MTKTKPIAEATVHNEKVDSNPTGPQPPKKQLIAYEQTLIEGLFNYLNTKPHGEVRGFIDQLSNGQAVEV